MAGSIITFYSYKGGVGRTFALANIGATLMKWGAKVLFIDWDLDAPGLHHYLEGASSRRQNLVDRRGLVDLIEDFSIDEESTPDWRSYVQEVTLGPANLTADVLTAGQQNDRYPRRARTLDWAGLYADRSLGNFIEECRSTWRSSYDFVLVDSRTGITDIGGICTAQLPDIVVFVFTANDQSIRGSLSTMKQAARARNRLPQNRSRQLFLPMMSRFDARDEHKLGEYWKSRAVEQLEELYRAWVPRSVDCRAVLDHCTVPYWPIWSFGERVAAVEESDRHPEYISYHFATLASMLSHRLESIDVLVNSRDLFVDSARRAVVARRVGLRRALVVSAGGENPMARAVAAELRDRGFVVEGARHGRASIPLTEIVDDDVSRAAITVLLVSSSSALSDLESDQVDSLLRVNRRSTIQSVLPVVLDDDGWSVLPGSVRRGSYLDLSSRHQAGEAARRVADEVERIVGEAAGRSPDADPAMRQMSLARDALDSGDLDLARSAFESLLSAENTSTIVRINALEGLARLSRRQGDVAASVTYLERALASRRQSNSEDGVASALVQLGDGQVAIGDLDAAEGCYWDAIKSSAGAGEIAARAYSGIADVLVRRGEYDAGLAIRHDKELPLYELSGDTRSAAAAWISVADVHYRRGDYSEALRILRDECLPRYVRLSESRSAAETWGKIADVYFGLGDYDEVLRIRREEELPLYERVGDSRSVAVAWGGVADVHFQRGDYDEALRIRRSECLPVYEQLGDSRAVALTWGKIADVYFGLGDYDEVLRIRREEELPLYERVGDSRSVAVAWGGVADVHFQRGDYDEALRIRRSECLPVYEQLGDSRAVALTWGKIADIHVERGEIDLATELQERRLEAFRQLGDVDGIAITQWGLAQMAIAQGEVDQAALDRLVESFQINVERRHTDGIAVVGGLLGQILTVIDHPDSEDVLRVAITAHIELGRAAGAKALTALLEGELDEEL